MKDFISRFKESTKLPVWARLGGYLRRLLSFIFFSLILLVITFLVSFDKLLPGTIFKFPTFIGLILLPFVLAYIVVTTEPAKKRVNPDKIGKIWRVAFLVFFVASTLVMFGILKYQLDKENRQLAQSKNIFTVSLVGNISQKRVDSTLIELDAQLSSLNRTYGIPGVDQKIGLVLFPDAVVLQNNSSAPKWADAYISFSTGKPIIYLPAEQPPTDSSRKSNAMASPVPGHEIAHYVIRKIVGEKNIGNIPLWFNEGLAQYESFKGFNRVLDRIVSKLGLWLLNLSNPDILKSNDYLLRSSDYPAQSIDIFYLASMGFTDYVETNYGGTKAILKDVSKGIEFNLAFERETGKKVDVVYGEWYEAFFNMKLSK